MSTCFRLMKYYFDSCSINSIPSIPIAIQGIIEVATKSNFYYGSLTRHRDSKYRVRGELTVLFSAYISQRHDDFLINFWSPTKIRLLPKIFHKSFRDFGIASPHPSRWNKIYAEFEFFKKCLQFIFTKKASQLIWEFG